ncbi:MAG TPA: DUF4244 domain-containing protein [Candidatus Limnocylindria bacterium]|jgi:hypothetical protein|nr:DUF4244 domain-containing protein [Candidatus Limnocylindria bacterium]
MTLVHQHPRPARLRRSLALLRSAEAGAVSAEYAVATVAACGFAGILYKIITSPQVLQLLVSLFTRALSFVF